MPSAVREKSQKSKPRRSHRTLDPHRSHAAPSLSPSQTRSDTQAPFAGADLSRGHPSPDTQRNGAPGDFSLRAHTREFMEDQDTSDMAALAESWAQSIPFDHLREALAGFGREYLRQFIVNQRTAAVRVGTPKWKQSSTDDDAENPFERLERYLLAAPEGGFVCVLDCTPETLRHNATMRRKQALAAEREATRLEALADATEKARRKTPRALSPRKVFEILARETGDE